MTRESIDDLSWYARRAASATAPLSTEFAPQSVERIKELLGLLRGAGIRGDAKSLTLFTRGLPPGCRPCLSGRGSNLYVTGLCTRECFFCFNQKPRRDETVVHGIPVAGPSDAPAIVRRFDLRSVGLSGGEPLLFPERTLNIVKALKAMEKPPRVDLYTNGDRATESVLRLLRSAGLDSIRFDAAARGYDLEPVRLARSIFDEVAVEIPVIPGDLPKLKDMILELDRLKVPFLNIHELFVCAENQERMAKAGEKTRDGAAPANLLWRPTARSMETCLELLLFALWNTKTLSVYLCSCGTQDNISRRGMRRRRRALAN